jgi:phosphoglycerol transferase MdoB-like AlkP superfamily enzyme
MRVTKSSKRKNTKSDADYNQAKVKKDAELDKILDKIKRSGYDSLTAAEKQRLFEQSQSL